MARGKGNDVLSLDDLLGEGSRGVLLDVVLEPGQVGVHFVGLSELIGLMVVCYNFEFR